MKKIVKRRVLAFGSIALAASFIIGIYPTHVMAATQDSCIVDENFADEDFNELVEIVLDVKNQNPQLEEEQLQSIITDRINKNRSISDIWNALTDSEKLLVIRYPFAALKVNTARNVATEQTEAKFGYSGLGDRSDAFRHGIWNAEMVILIGDEKAEMFATAHEDKDTQGVESDGYPKEAHKAMDLHNNEVGRSIGEAHLDSNEDELADIIYTDIFSENTAFQWLHD